ncbi:hypothetical protein AVEN_84987-1 [Araneus ventricosus]|uniref:Uncharacterized protein n=1 Tax=Araneus ventricosus TaxID=182803 RepID=A0A4Y2C0L3_ARAVE|nr:hypothetical protein AVEN_84987-1 [Araneus ventricosus]
MIRRRQNSDILLLPEFLQQNVNRMSEHEGFIKSTDRADLYWNQISNLRESSAEVETLPPGHELFETAVMPPQEITNIYRLS